MKKLVQTCANLIKAYSDYQDDPQVEIYMHRLNEALDDMLDLSDDLSNDILVQLNKLKANM